ncbi:UNVERIFIED_CONTAM: hypothetical protein Scaly_0055800 [Sesamum calycinum]|uniref:Reverse transcriptase Ty1/copia-type domain-containing protein n=1 Tax=Sesamum calycinum TaxID=2727403 RepID=A0AAW2SUU5_9LAMI
MVSNKLPEAGTHVFDEVIWDYNFIKNEFDPCIYKKISGSSVAYTAFYVDDIFLIGNNVKMLDIKVWLSTQFSMKDMGLEEIQDEKLKMRIPSGEHRTKLSKKQSPKTNEELKRMLDIPYASAVRQHSKNSKKATTVDSTMEDEYIAISEVIKEAIWLKNYIKELDVVPSIVELVVIFCDNNGAIAQAKELRSHHRSKHILRRYYLLKEMVIRGDILMD